MENKGAKGQGWHSFREVPAVGKAMAEGQATQGKAIEQEPEAETQEVEAAMLQALPHQEQELEAQGTNSAGESHCYHCGKEGHWARECLHLTAELQAQLHVVLEASEDQEQEGKTGYQFFHARLLQADALPDHRVYLDGCYTVTAFKSKQYLSNIHTVDKGIKINFQFGSAEDKSSWRLQLHECLVHPSGDHEHLLNEQAGEEVPDHVQQLARLLRGTYCAGGGQVLQGQKWTTIH